MFLVRSVMLTVRRLSLLVLLELNCSDCRTC